MQYEGNVLEVKVPFEGGEKARTALLASFKDKGLQVGQTDNIGSQVGNELKRSGIIAMVVAILGILIYITVRFEFPYAVGAIVALVHDVFITIGVYSMLGHQFSLPFVSALLAMIGYSTNDTIIVFDRMREELKLNRGRVNYREVCNHSINLTLSRTVITHTVTSISVIALMVLGVGVVKDISVTMFIATPIMLLWHRGKRSEVARSV